MCLDFIDAYSKEKAKSLEKKGFAWKIFKKNPRNGKLYGVYRDYFEFDKNRWCHNESNSSVNISNMNASYKLGFHCFVSRDEARTFLKYLKILSYSNLVLKKVKVKNVTTVGQEHRRELKFKVLVCDSIKIESKSKK